jgi:hypothetical protein
MAKCPIKPLGNLAGVSFEKRQTIIGSWRMLNVWGSHNVAVVVPIWAGFIALDDGQFNGTEFAVGGYHKSLRQGWAADQIGNGFE